MTTNEKMTYVTALDEVLALDCISTEAREKLTQLKEQVAKRNQSWVSNFVDKQIAKRKLAEQVHNILLVHDEPMTISDIINSSDSLISYSIEEIDEICKLLVACGKIVKPIEKCEARFIAVQPA